MRNARIIFPGLVQTLATAAAMMDAVAERGPQTIVISDEGSRVLTADELAALKSRKLEPKAPRIGESTPRAEHKNEREKARRVRQMERRANKDSE